MAALCGRKTLRVSTSPATKAAIANVFGKSSQPVEASAPSAASAFSQPSSSSRFSLQRLVSSTRLPVQLSSAQSLSPLHSATAAALYTSLLSLHSSNWGCLSEGNGVFSPLKYMIFFSVFLPPNLQLFAFFSSCANQKQAALVIGYFANC